MTFKRYFPFIEKCIFKWFGWNVLNFSFRIFKSIFYSDLIRFESAFDHTKTLKAKSFSFDLFLAQSLSSSETMAQHAHPVALKACSHNSSFNTTNSSISSFFAIFFPSSEKHGQIFHWVSSVKKQFNPLSNHIIHQQNGHRRSFERFGFFFNHLVMPRSVSTENV